MLCSKLHHQGVFSLFDFSYKNQGKPLVNHRSFVNFRLISGLEAHNLQPIGPSTGADGSSVMSANAARPAPSDCPPLAPDAINSLISLEKSASLQTRQLYILISNSKNLVDDFVGELTLRNYLMNTFCDMKSRNAGYFRAGSSKDMLSAKAARPAPSDCPPLASDTMYLSISFNK